MPLALPFYSLQIQNDLAVLTKRLSHLNDSIARKTASRNEYDKTIQETEAAYLKVLPVPLPCLFVRAGGTQMPTAHPCTPRPRTDSGELANAADGAEAREREVRCSPLRF